MTKKFIIPRKAFRRNDRPSLPMIRWVGNNAEIDLDLLTPENVQALADELFGTYEDDCWVDGVRVYEFYRVSSATQNWQFQRAECLRVFVGGRQLKCFIGSPSLYNFSSILSKKG